MTQDHDATAAELARLLGDIGEQADGWYYDERALAERLLAAGVTPPGRADAERLREALSKYGRHQVNCAAQRGDEPDCNCGLRATLAANPAAPALLAENARLREALAEAVALAGMLTDNMKGRDLLPYYTNIADKTLPGLRAVLRGDAMTPEAADRRERLREAATALEAKLARIHDQRIDLEFPWEREWKDLRALLAAPAAPEPGEGDGG